MPWFIMTHIQPWFHYLISNTNNNNKIQLTESAGFISALFFCREYNIEDVTPPAPKTQILFPFTDGGNELLSE